MNTRILYLCKGNNSILLAKNPPKLKSRQKHRGIVTDIVDNYSDLCQKGWRVKINQATIDYILTKETESLILEPWQYVKLKMDFDVVESGQNFYMYKYNDRPILTSIEPEVIMDVPVLPQDIYTLRMCDSFIEHAYGITNVVGVLPVIMTAEIMNNKKGLTVENDLRRSR